MLGAWVIGMRLLEVFVVAVYAHKEFAAKV
jgi:hypothetical protein